MMARYVVAQNTQANIEGTVYGAGQEVSLENDVAAPLLAAGTIVRTSEAKPKPERRRG